MTTTVRFVVTMHHVTYKRARTRHCAVGVWHVTSRALSN